MIAEMSFAIWFTRFSNCRSLLVVANMRFALLCSIAFGVDIVVASVCKPRHSTDSKSTSLILIKTKN